MAGLLDFLSPQSGGLGQPQGFMGRAQSFREQNPGALTALGAGIMSGNPAQGFANVAPVIARGRQQNATAQYLLTKGIAKSPEEAMTLAQQPELLRIAIKDPDQYSLRADAAERYGLKKGTPEFNNYVLGSKAGGAVDYSQIPQYYKRKDGSYGIGVLGDNATMMDVELPEGVELLGPLGTSLDKAEGTALGKDTGEAKALLHSVTAKMPGIEAVVQQLDTLADKATYTTGGQLIDSAMRQSGMEPREAAVARAEYIATVDNQVLPLLRDTFGAQFTVQEGQSLRATLGDPDKSPQEKKAVLRAFIQQKYRNIEALAAQTGQTVPQGGISKIIGGKMYIRDANGDWYEQ